jgi:hypothetical protein
MIRCVPMRDSSTAQGDPKPEVCALFHEENLCTQWIIRFTALHKDRGRSVEQSGSSYVSSGYHCAGHSGLSGFVSGISNDAASFLPV